MFSRPNGAWVTALSGVALLSSLGTSMPALAQAQAQLAAGTISGAAGAQVDLDVSFTAGGTPVSAVRFELSLPSSVSYVSTTAGTSATAAGKSTSASLVTGGVRVLVFGLNTDAIGSGQLARIRLQIAASAAPGTQAVGTRVLDASDPDGNLVSVTGSNGAVTVEGAQPACGDGHVDPGETCDSNCPTSCDDGNACTADTLAGSAAACTAACTFPAITQCRGGDGCCAPGCNSTNDSDCSVSCGNGVVEAGETCDPPGSCPTTCNDGNACTSDALAGSAAQCSAACTFAAITQCRGGDGCCAPGCNSTNDSDCSVSCGNGVLETGETCDPPGSCPTSCNDGNACTRDAMTGSAAQCSTACAFAPITQCSGGDGCCAPGCNSTNDSDCSVSCGNGVLEAGETCDPPGTCPTSCNDGDACTADTLVGSAVSCSAACAFAPISQCRGGDGCCAAGCNSTNDSDCSAACGNGILEAGETCDPSGSCPTSCDDGNACTTDALSGSAEACNAACTATPISECQSGDGCCPAGCGGAGDSDCETPVLCADQDGDKFGAPSDGCSNSAADCDDTNPAIYPTAAETCNAIDDNCDGQVDEGFDLQSDASNCGTCGHVCASGESCASGACTAAGGLTLGHPEPGLAGVRNTIQVTGATPGMTVELAYGLRTGQSRIRGCNGATYEIARFWTVRKTADAQGNATFRVRIARWAAGLTVYMQAADLTTCKTSPMVQHTFTGKDSLEARSVSELETTLGASGEIEGEALMELDGDQPIAGRIGGGCGCTTAGSGQREVVTSFGLLAVLMSTLVTRRRRTQQVPSRPSKEV